MKDWKDILLYFASQLKNCEENGWWPTLYDFIIMISNQCYSVPKNNSTFIFTIKLLKSTLLHYEVPNFRYTLSPSLICFSIPYLFYTPQELILHVGFVKQRLKKQIYQCRRLKKPAFKFAMKLFPKNFICYCAFCVVSKYLVRLSFFLLF